MPEVTPALLSSILASAMSHPTRLDAMEILLKRSATPAEIAVALEEPLSNVTYHIGELAKFGCIRLVETRPADAGRVMEHVYEAVDRIYFDADAWGRLDRTQKLKVAITIMRLVSEDVANAMAKMTFFEPDDNHLSRSPMSVDFDGWEEVISLLDGTVDGLQEIEEEIARRCADDPQIQTFPIRVAILQFRVPDKK